MVVCFLNFISLETNAKKIKLNLLNKAKEKKKQLRNDNKIVK